MLEQICSFFKKKEQIGIEKRGWKNFEILIDYEQIKFLLIYLFSRLILRRYVPHSGNVQQYVAKKVIVCATIFLSRQLPNRFFVVSYVNKINP